MSLKKGQQETQDKLTRIAIVSSDKCKPKRCRQECKKSCPVVRMGMYPQIDLLLPGPSCLPLQEECRTFRWPKEMLSTTGKLCIEATPDKKIAAISETLCIGCGICAKVRRKFLDTFIDGKIFIIFDNESYKKGLRAVKLLFSHSRRRSWPVARYCTILPFSCGGGG